MPHLQPTSSHPQPTSSSPWLKPAPHFRRPRLAIPLIFLAITACRQPHPYRLSDIHSVSLQPVGYFPTTRLEYLQTQLTRFLHKEITLLPPINMPPGIRNDTKDERYSADSLVHFLSQVAPDSRSIVIGLTTEDIFTTVRDSTGGIKQPLDKYAVWGIFGLGSCPGRSPIVSIHRLLTTNEQLFLHRLRTVVLHELGHNLGLPHCPNPHCIMNDAHEKVATVDDSGDDFCASCQKKLN
jgi:archaemetzincin